MELTKTKINSYSEFSKLYELTPIVPNFSFQEDMFVTIKSISADLNAFIASPYVAYLYT